MLLILGYILFACIKINKITPKEIDKIFSDIGKVEINAKIGNYKIKNWKPLNNYFKDSTNNYYINLVGDFNSDEIMDMAVIGKYQENNIKYSPKCFLAILSNLDNNQISLDFFYKIGSEQAALYYPVNLTSNKIIYVASTPEVGEIIWKDSKYQFCTDVESVDTSLSIIINRSIDFQTVLVYICKIRDTNWIKWAGYNKTHRQSNNSWTIIEPGRTDVESKLIINTPDDLFDWTEIFKEYSEVFLLLFRANESLDSLIDQQLDFYWDNPVSSKSAREIIDEIDSPFLLKKWELTPENLDKWNWTLEYP